MDEEEMLMRAVALALEQEKPGDDEDEEKMLKRAIAMSLEEQ